MPSRADSCLILLFEIEKSPPQHDWQRSDYLPSMIVRLNVSRPQAAPMIPHLLSHLGLPDVTVVHVLEDNAETLRKIDAVYENFEKTYNLSVEWYVEEIEVEALAAATETDGPSDPSYILSFYGQSHLDPEQVTDPAKEPPIAVLILDYLDSRHLAGFVQSIQSLGLAPFYWRLLPWSEEAYQSLKVQQQAFLDQANQCLACLPDHQEDALACRGCALHHLRPFASRLLASDIIELRMDEEEIVWGEEENDADKEENEGDGEEEPENPIH